MNFKDLDLYSDITEILDTLDESQVLYENAERLSQDGKNASLELHVSENSMEVTAVLTPAVSYGKALSVENVLALLHDKEITYGILHSEIAALVRKQKESDKEVSKVIALGTQSTHLQKFSFEFHEAITSENQNFFQSVASPSFKGLTPLRHNPSTPVHVKKGDVLVKIHTNQEWQGSCNVYGKPVEDECADQVNFSFQLGVGLFFRDSSGTSLEYLNILERDDFPDDGIDIVVARDGELLLQRSASRISFSLPETRVISTLPNSSQTLFIKSHVRIKTNTLKTLSLKANGNITIMGNVLGSSLHSGGNIYVYGKLLENCKIKARGSIFCRGVEHATLEAGEDIFIEKSCYNGKLSAGCRLFSGFQEGAIFGGEVLAAASIFAHECGNNRGIRTLLTIDPGSRNQNTERILATIREKLQMDLNKIERLMSLMEEKNTSAMFKLTAEEAENLTLVHAQKETIEDQIRKIEDKILALQPMNFGLSSYYLKGIFLGEVHPNCILEIGGKIHHTSKNEKGYRQEL